MLSGHDAWLYQHRTLIKDNQYIVIVYILYPSHIILYNPYSHDIYCVLCGLSCTITTYHSTSSTRSYAVCITMYHSTDKLPAAARVL